MLIFVFYSIFKLQFDQKKGPILLMAAVISAARMVVISNSLDIFSIFYHHFLIFSYTVRAALLTAAISKIGPFFDQIVA